MLRMLGSHREINTKIKLWTKKICAGFNTFFYGLIFNLWSWVNFFFIDDIQYLITWSKIKILSTKYIVVLKNTYYMPTLFFGPHELAIAITLCLSSCTLKQLFWNYFVILVVQAFALLFLDFLDHTYCWIGHTFCECENINSC